MVVVGGGRIIGSGYHKFGGIIDAGRETRHRTCLHAYFSDVDYMIYTFVLRNCYCLPMIRIKSICHTLFLLLYSPPDTCITREGIHFPPHTCITRRKGILFPP